MRGKNGLPLFASNWIDGELVREMFRIWHPFRVRCDGGAVTRGGRRDAPRPRATVCHPFRMSGEMVNLCEGCFESGTPSGCDVIGGYLPRVVVAMLLDPGLRSVIPSG